MYIILFLFLVSPFYFYFLIFYGLTHRPPPVTRHPSTRYPLPAARHPSPVLHKNTVITIFSSSFQVSRFKDYVLNTELLTLNCWHCFNWYCVVWQGMWNFDLKRGFLKKLLTSGALGCLAFVLLTRSCSKGTQRQFSENIFSEDDLRPWIFGTFAVIFLACRPPLGFSNI